MSRKFVYYLEGISRGIVITDQHDDITLDEVSENASNLMVGDKVSKFSTKTDILLVRPSDIKAIHITDEDNDDIEDTTIDDKNLQAFIPDIDLDDIDNDEIKSDQDIQDIQENTEDESEEITIPDDNDGLISLGENEENVETDNTD